MLEPRKFLLGGLLALWGAGAGAGAARAAPQPGVPGVPAAANPGPGSESLSLETRTRRKLTGRFLHITDFHPDPFYKTYSSTESNAACHRKRGPAGVYGAETSGCDSPTSLVNETFKWIQANIRDDIDFIVWTGDSARHDNDERIPRTQKQIIQQNEYIVTKFMQVFGNNDTDPKYDLTIPIVPTFGNNDIMPHNIFLEGPNKWTLKYLDIWRNFIPEAQRHQFQQGGWFYVEVIPGKLAVISLNTMYFFNSNSGVDGCANKHEPGYEHMEWLRIQLQSMRDRGMKAILMGHVPPARVDSKESWDETCWQKYTLWQRQFRDIIVGSLFGHMNIDHFMLQDSKQLRKSTKKGRMASSMKTKSERGKMQLLEDGEVTVASASDYLLDLRDTWAKLPSPPVSNKNSLSIDNYVDTKEEAEAVSMWQWLNLWFSTPKKSGKGNGDDGKKKKKEYLHKIGGKYAERYSVSIVSPSVVPNYFPTMRLFEYNITGLEDLHTRPTHYRPRRPDALSEQLPITESDLSDDDAYTENVSAIVEMKKKKKEKNAMKKKKKYKFKVPKEPSKSSPPGPAYSPQPLTLIGYTQFFANLTRINNDFVEPSLSINNNSPYTIFGLEVNENGKVKNRKWKEGKHHKHQGKKPRPRPHPKEFGFEVEYDTRDDKKFPDLTVRRYVEYARRIGQNKAGSNEVEMEEMKYEDEEHSFESNDYDTDAVRENSELEASKKGKKKKGKKHGKNKAWFTFVKRAFVATMDPREIDELFGANINEGVEGDDSENMEL